MIQWLAILCFFFFLVSCGLQSSLERTSHVAEETMQNVEEANRLQQEILAKNAELARGMHLQTLAIALENMFKPENTAQLKPPTRMLPYGEAYAKEATEDEIIRLMQVLFGDAYYGGLLSFKSRLTSLVGAGVIAGLTPLEKVNNIFKNQIEDRGPYEETAYQFAMARYLLIRDALFLPIIEKVKYLNASNLKSAVEYFGYLKHLANSPYRDLFEIKIPGLFINKTLDRSEIATLATNAKNRFEKKLKPEDLLNPTVQALLAELVP